jgi:hypothetical protein
MVAKAFALMQLSRIHECKNALVRAFERFAENPHPNIRETMEFARVLEETLSGP